MYNIILTWIGFRGYPGFSFKFDDSSITFKSNRNNGILLCVKFLSGL